jgi:hypothetical protein
MACAATNGSGTAPPELFVPIRPGAQLIKPGEATYLQSLQTGKFCRVVADAGRQQVLCDSDTLDGATPLTYTGSGAQQHCHHRRRPYACAHKPGPLPSAQPLAPAAGVSARLRRRRASLACAGISYQGLVLTSPGSGGGAAYFAAPGSLPGAAAATVTPSPGPTLRPDTAINILDSSSGGAVRVDGPGSAAYAGSGNGSSPQEQFCAYSPSDPARTSPFVPGDMVLLKNKVNAAAPPLLNSSAPPPPTHTHPYTHTPTHLHHHRHWNFIGGPYRRSAAIAPLHSPWGQRRA